MGGFEFTIGSVKDRHEIAYFNLTFRNVWVEALIAAGEIDTYDVRCPFDEDGVCYERGCLNPDERGRGYLVNINEFLATNKRVLSFLESHTDSLSHKRTWTIADAKQLEGFRLEEITDREPALRAIISLIASLEAAIDRGARHVFIWDRLSDPDFTPCPRYWYTVGPLHDRGFPDRKVKPCKAIREHIMPYDEALEKLRNGEWRAMINRVW